MKSSFVRKGATSTADLGTRPGLHGQTLISTGWADLDKTLKGGLPLGSLSLLIEDCHSQQHLNFIRYFLAESVCTKQPAAWFACSAPEGGVASFLPAVTTDTSSTSTSTTSTSKGGSATATASGEEGDGELRIAWQYRKYIQSAQKQREQEQVEADAAARQAKLRGAAAGGAPAGGKTAAEKALEAGVAKQWCQSYDLTRSMDPEVVKQHGLTCTATTSVATAVEQAKQFMTRFVPPPTPASGVPVRAPPTPAGRVVIQSLLSPTWDDPTVNLGQAGSASADSPSQGTDQQQQGVQGSQGCVQGSDYSEDEVRWRQVAVALYQLRHAVQDARCAVLVTLQADLLPPSWLLKIQHLCHVVLCLSSLSDSSDVYKLLPDPTTASALLSVPRLPAIGMLGPRVQDSQLYVVRNKRRKLTITAVEVDPDAEARQQELLTAVTQGLAGLLGNKAGAAGQEGAKQTGVSKAAGRVAARSKAADTLDF